MYNIVMSTITLKHTHTHTNTFFAWVSFHDIHCFVSIEIILTGKGNLAANGGRAVKAQVCGLRLVGSRVHILLRAGIFVPCVYCVLCEVAGSVTS
jgi:hypothetical protein